MKDYLAECARLKSSLEAIGGLEVWPTDTHFMLVCLRFGKAAALKEYLAREEGILIRDASNFEGWTNVSSALPPRHRKRMTGWWRR